MSAALKPIQDYSLLTDDECDVRIQAAKKTLGERCVILGHHYQRNEVFKHADVSGDSLKLSSMRPSQKRTTLSFVACILWPKWPIFYRDLNK